MSSFLSTSDIGTYYTNLQNQIQDAINSSSGLDDDATQQMDDMDKQILLRNERQQEQLKEIQEKQKLVLTRSRMLQIAQEKNIFKKKIIYTLLAIILIILILTLCAYVYISKKGNNTNRK